MKKALCVFLVTLVALSFTACPGRRAGDVIRIGMWDMHQAPGIERVLAEFTAQTGIQTILEVTPWGDYWTLLEAAATGGALPDVFWMHPNEIQRYMAAGLLMDLTDRIAASSVADMANFPPDIVALYSLHGRHFGIPKDLDTITLWFNRRHFEDAGLAFPTNYWTWEDLRNAARALSDPANMRFGIVFTPGESHTGYWNFIYQNDGYVISRPDRRRSGFDNPRTIEAMEFIVGLIDAGYAPDHTIFTGTDKMALMASGVVSMATFGSWMLNPFRASDFFVDNVDVVMLPTSNHGRRATIFNGLAWSAAANTNRPEEVWQLLEFLSSEHAQTRLSEEGVGMSAFNGTADVFAAQFPEFNVAAVTDSLRYAVMRPYSINTGAWEFMAATAWSDAWEFIRPVDVVARDIAQRMNDLLALE